MILCFFIKFLILTKNLKLLQTLFSFEKQFLKLSSLNFIFLLLLKKHGWFHYANIRLNYINLFTCFTVYTLCY